MIESVDQLIKHVRCLIKADKRSYRELGRITGIDHGKIWKFAHEKKSLSLKNFLILAEMYDVVSLNPEKKCST